MNYHAVIPVGILLLLVVAIRKMYFLVHLVEQTRGSLCPDEVPTAIITLVVVLAFFCLV